MPRSLSQISYSLKGCKTDKEKKEYLRGIIKTSLPERYKTRAYENLGGIHRRLGEYKSAGDAYSKAHMTQKASRCYVKADNKRKEKDFHKDIESSKLVKAITENKFILISAIGSFILSIFLLSSNITGNVVSNVTQNTSNKIGLVFLVISLIALMVYKIRN